MLQKRINSGGTRKVTPPQPTTFTTEQKATYLASLRNDRPARPSGSRPIPSKAVASTFDHDLPPRSGSALSMRKLYEDVTKSSGERTNQPLLSKRASMPLTTSVYEFKGRPLVPSPNSTVPIVRRKVSPTATIEPSVSVQHGIYLESGSRQLEKKEAHFLREALETLDNGDDEQRLHDAAKNEAADLVWKHQNPNLAEAEKTAAYRNPDFQKRRYGDLGQNKQRSMSSDAEVQPTSRSAPGSFVATNDVRRAKLPWLSRQSRMSEPVVSVPPDSNIKQQGERRRSSGGRLVSSGSSKGVFRNPEDKIYEEPEEEIERTVEATHQDLPLRNRPRNSLPRGSRPLPEKPNHVPIQDQPKVERFEIWKNSPTQSRKAEYTSSSDIPSSVEVPEVETPSTPKGRAMEIRSEEIRAATSMKKKDRSPKLPTPTAVSDRPGRPIVSFDPKWQKSSGSPSNSQDMERQAHVRTYGDSTSCPSASIMPTITILEDTTRTQGSGVDSRRILPPEKRGSFDSSAIPSIVVPTITFPDMNEDSVPAISINGPVPNHSIPTINLPDEAPSVPEIRLPEENTERPLPTQPVQSNPRARPLPSINRPVNESSRPLPSHTQSSPSSLPPRTHQAVPRTTWLSRCPTTTGSTVSCTACDLPISGRVVTASGSTNTTAPKARLHPECFTCNHCNTALECVSFYPEPEASRITRFEALYPDEADASSLARSTTSDLRFYCHLDYHELFSPRCHTCKTPIEGSIIIALGRHYHTEHFFCAECGDPFSETSPFVEHNNYPYCIGCHTRRTSARCRGCKAPILEDTTVEALGAKWHDACFVCYECNGDFGDEGRFFVREVDVDLTDKERRRGLTRKVEERAVCQACEERRVKNVHAFL